MALLVLPGMIAALFLVWAPWIMADGETNVGACIKGSIDLVKANLGGTLVFVLVYFIINMVAGFVPFGGLIAGPVTAVMLASGHQRLDHSPKLAAAA